MWTSKAVHTNSKLVDLGGVAINELGEKLTVEAVGVGTGPSFGHICRVALAHRFRRRVCGGALLRVSPEGGQIMWGWRKLLRSVRNASMGMASTRSVPGFNDCST